MYFVRGLFFNILLFCKLFRSDARDNDPDHETVFLSSSGLRWSLGPPINGIIISGLNILNEEEMKNLTSKSWRHAWANWAKDHQREDFRTIAFAMLSHSEQIYDSNYHLIDRIKAVSFSGGVLDDLGVNLEVSLAFYFNLI